MQAGYLRQVRDLMAEHRCPLIVAGDIFDDGWRPGRCPPALINFALEHLPPCLAVPGQHDLPHHRYEDVSRSAYWTLCRAGLVIDLPPGQPREIPTVTPLRLHGFPWGAEVLPIHAHDLLIEVAVIHAYAWTPKTGYPDAPPAGRVSSWLERLQGFDFAHFGDNHRQFLRRPKEPGSPWIWNPGTFVRRKADEADHCPAVGLLRASGIERHHLDISQDRTLTASPGDHCPAVGIDAGELLEELLALGEQSLDFAAALRRAADTADPAVRDVLLRTLEEARD